MRCVSRCASSGPSLTKKLRGGAYRSKGAGSPARHVAAPCPAGILPPLSITSRHHEALHHPHRQRRGPDRRGRAPRSARLRAPRPARPHRHAHRLRYQPVRCLHPAPGRPGGEELHRARRAGRGSSDHYHRGTVSEWNLAPPAAGLLGEARAAVRLLHAGHDHDRGGSARNSKPTEGEIRHALEGNLCRCTGYQNIVAAVQAAASAR